VHPTAIIEPGVEIGSGTTIWDNVHIRTPARIGVSCIIGEKTHIAYGVSIGDYVKINAHVYVCTAVRIENRVMVSAGVTFTNDKFPRAFGPAENQLASSEPNEETKSTLVGEGATIGAGTVIGPGVRIGRMAMIGMGSVVVHDVGAHALVLGVPARLRGYVCICGAPLPIRMAAARAIGRCNRCDRQFHGVQLGTRSADLQFQREHAGEPLAQDEGKQ
jgi:acetyltransferase-like isoleucine patch superfamily enzyme